MLFVIPSPIGNLEDFTYRAVKLIPTLDYLLCEDTRKTRVLLNHYFTDIKSIKLLPFHENNEKKKVAKALELLESGLTLGLICNAGTPAISDPGYRLIHACRSRNIKIVALPGPSAFLTALSASGLPTDRFTFTGFLPKKASDMKSLMTTLFENRKVLGTIIAYESPYRLIASLILMKTVLGDINVIIAREITKMFETYYSGKISEVISQLGNKLKGEIVILFNLNEESRYK